MLEETICVAALDDDPHLRMLVDLALTAAGFDVTLYATGAEALAGLTKRKAHLLLLDLIMPGMDGYETYTRLRADPALRDVPVAFMTGKSGKADIESCLAAGAVAVLSKPIILDRFAADVQRVVAMAKARPGHA